jgi:hypothetical protein
MHSFNGAYNMAHPEIEALSDHEQSLRSAMQPVSFDRNLNQSWNFKPGIKLVTAVLRNPSVIYRNPTCLI